MKLEYYDLLMIIEKVRDEATEDGYKIDSYEDLCEYLVDGKHDYIRFTL